MNASRIRPAAVAGLFYPGDADELRRFVDASLAAAPAASPPARAVIAPHAGYVYSGEVAAFAWRALPRDARRVLIVGPAHRVPCRGLAAPSHDAFATPLGPVPIDAELREAALTLDGVDIFDAAHAMEHSLEVHLPFLQRALPEARVLPLVVGAAAPESVRDVLALAWRDSEAVIVVSSDLSHYLPYDIARRVDAATIKRMLALAADIRPEEACGCMGVNGLMLLARAQGAEGHLLDYRNSGDTAGDRDAVVGYAAIAFASATAAEQAS